MLRILAAATIVLGLTEAAAAQQPAFQPGQKWTVKDSPMTIVIGTVEPFAKDKTAVSVSVFGVPCPPDAGCSATDVAHAPFDGEVLAQSVDKLVDSHAATAAQYENGYANWKQAKGGIFTIPVRDLPKLLFRTLTDGKASQGP